MNGIALFNGGPTSGPIRGQVRFHQASPEEPTLVCFDLWGFEPHQKVACHIHEYGDLSRGCESAGGHWNPFDEPHGNFLTHGLHHHAGDLLNNLTSNEDGEVYLCYADPL